MRRGRRTTVPSSWWVKELRIDDDDDDDDDEDDDDDDDEDKLNLVYSVFCTGGYYIYMYIHCICIYIASLCNWGLDKYRAGLEVGIHLHI